MKRAIAILFLSLAIQATAHAQGKVFQDIAKRNDANAIGGSAASMPRLLSPDDLWQKIIDPAVTADLKYASALAAAANTNGSKVRKQCIDALIAVNEQASGKNIPLGPDGQPMPKPDPSIVTHMEQMAEVIDNLAPGGPLMTSCAGAAGLLRMQVLQVIQGIVTGSVTAATIGPAFGLP